MWNYFGDTQTDAATGAKKYYAGANTLGGANWVDQAAWDTKYAGGQRAAATGGYERAAQTYGTSNYNTRIKQGYTDAAARENTAIQYGNQLGTWLKSGAVNQQQANQLWYDYTQAAAGWGQPAASPTPAQTQSPAGAMAQQAQPTAPPPATAYLQSPAYANPRTQAYYDDQLRLAAAYGPAQAQKLATEATQRAIADYPDVYSGAMAAPSAYVAPQQASAPASQSGSYATQKANDYYAQQFQANVSQYGAAQAAAIAKAATDGMVKEFPSVYGTAVEAPPAPSGWGEPMPGAVVYGAGAPAASQAGAGYGAPVTLQPTAASQAPGAGRPDAGYSLTPGAPATGYSAQALPLGAASGQSGSTLAQLGAMQQAPTQPTVGAPASGPVSAAVDAKIAALKQDGAMPYTNAQDMAIYAQALLAGNSEGRAQELVFDSHAAPSVNGTAQGPTISSLSPWAAQGGAFGTAQAPVPGTPAQPTTASMPTTPAIGGNDMQVIGTNGQIPAGTGMSVGLTGPTDNITRGAFGGGTAAGQDAINATSQPQPSAPQTPIVNPNTAEIKQAIQGGQMGTSYGTGGGGQGTGAGGQMSYQPAAYAAPAALAAAPAYQNYYQDTTSPYDDNYRRMLAGQAADTAEQQYKLAAERIGRQAAQRGLMAHGGSGIPAGALRDLAIQTAGARTQGYNDAMLKTADSAAGYGLQRAQGLMSAQQQAYNQYVQNQQLPYQIQQQAQANRGAMLQNDQAAATAPFALQQAESQGLISKIEAQAAQKLLAQGVDPNAWPDILKNAARIALTGAGAAAGFFTGGGAMGAYYGAGAGAAAAGMIK